MRIKGVLFDKDGTLVDFFSLWLQAAYAVIPKIIQELDLDDSPQMEQYLLETIGIVNGHINPDGGICYKSYGDLALDLATSLEKKKIYRQAFKIHVVLVKLFDEFVTSDEVTFKTFTPIHELVSELKKRNIKVGLATADTIYSAKYCLTKLGVMDDFDYVGGDDGMVKPKPNVDMFHIFTEKYKLLPHQVAVVGDTLNDMIFAKECGAVAIGVLSGVSKEEKLKEEGDYIISSVEQLISLLDQL